MEAWYSRDRRIMNFPVRLRGLRKQASLSLDQLAFLSGVSKAALSHLELGRRTPRWETVCKLANALKVSTEKFR